MISQKYRIPKAKIDYLLKKGEEIHSSLFIIRHAPNEQDNFRYSVIVSKKLEPKAVDRTKLRRQLYEAIRLYEKESSKDNYQDLVIIPKKRILSSTYQELEAQLSKQLSKL